jgi:hypothetical protein
MSPQEIAAREAITDWVKEHLGDGLVSDFVLGFLERDAWLPGGPLGVSGSLKAGARGAAKSFTRRNFRQNLSRTKPAPDDVASHAHHTLPVEFADQIEAFGIKIHDPKYGAWWEAIDHLKSSASYNRAWQQFLEKRDLSPDSILAFGRTLAKDYGLDVSY